MSGAHTSEKRWYRNQNPQGNDSIADKVQAAAITILDALQRGESMFQELLELNDFAGGTDQDLANQLFKEIYEARKQLGVSAVVEVDVVGGAVENPVVITAGTGYVDGTGKTLDLVNTAGGGDEQAQLTYDVVGGGITNVTVLAAGTTYTNGTGQTVTDFPNPTTQVSETEANATEVGMVVDATAAVTSIHELYLALTNVAVTQKDRSADLRRMS